LAELTLQITHLKSDLDNIHQLCFASEEYFAAYLNWLKKYTSKFAVEIQSWALMTNHVHLLVLIILISGQEPYGKAVTNLVWLSGDLLIGIVSVY